MERKLLDMMNQLSISEYNPRMEYCDRFQFVNLPFDSGLFLFYASSKWKLTMWFDMDRRWDYGIQNNR